MIAEHLVMLREGKVLFSGKTSELLAAQQPILVAEPEYAVDLNKLVDLVKASGHTVTIHDGALHIISPKGWSAELNRLAFDAGITLISLTSVLPTLEETFFEMTGDSE